MKSSPDTQVTPTNVLTSGLNPDAPVFVPSPEPWVDAGEALECRRNGTVCAMETAPDGKDVQEFKFRRLCDLKLIPSGPVLDLSHPLNVVSTSSKFGVVFAGTPFGVQCIPLSDVIELQETRPNSRSAIENYKRRELNLGCLPSHVAVNCVGELLAVVINHQQVPVLQIYSVQSFGSQEVSKIAEVRLSSTPNTRALDVQWNPAVPSMIGCVLSDGSAMVCEFNPNGGPNISSAPTSAQANCLCWSPKGKQVVLGAKNGSLTQYKPDLKAVKSYPAPQLGTGHLEVISVHWLSTVQFIAVYKDRIDPQARSVVVVVNVPKTGQSFVNYDDLCFSIGTLRHEHYFIHIAAWNVLLVSTGNCFEVSVLHHENDAWVQWRLDGASRAELPLTENKDDVFTVGVALNTSATKPIPIGDSGTIPPAPFLLYMSDQGVLSIFHTMNLLPGAPALCSAPQELPKQFFSVPEIKTGEPKSQPAVSQDKPVAPQQPSGIGAGDGPAAQPAKSGFAGSPFQLGSQPPTSSVSPFQLSTTSSTLPSFGNLTAQLGSQAPSLFAQSSPQATSASGNSAKPVVPKSQQTFGSGTSTLPQFTGSGLFGGSSAVKGDSSQSAASTTSSGSLGFQFPPSSTTTAIPSTTSQLMPKPQATVPVAAAPVSSAPSVTSFQPAAPSPTPPPPQVPPTPADPPPVDDSLIMNEIFKEIASVKNLLAKFELDSAAVNKLEKNKHCLPDIRVKLHDLEVFEEELRETTASEQAEVNALKISLVEMCSCLENIKAKLRQSTSQRYLEILESRELDPVLKKMLKNIEQSTLFVETKLKEATHHLNVTWEKQKEPGSLKNFDIPNMEAIYQIMAMNMKILAFQQARIAELENRLANALKLRKKTKPSNWSSLGNSEQNAQLEKLADKLLQTRIDSTIDASHSVKETSNRYFALANLRKELPKDKEAILWKWLKSHKVIRTKVARPALPDNDALNRSFARSTPTKSPISVPETPLVNPATMVNRNLFSTKSDAASSIGPSLVTSTPQVDVKSKEKSSFSLPAIESPSVSIKPVESKVSALSTPKNVFGTSFGATPTVTKEVSFANTSITSTFNLSPIQTASPKFEVSSLSNPPTPLKPKDSPKYPTAESALTSATETESSHVSSGKSTTSTNVISSLLSSGSTVTISEKGKAPAATTAANSMFGGLLFGQSSGFAGFGLGTAASTPATATSTSSAKLTLSGTSSAFGAGVASSTPATTATPTTTSSLLFSSLPASGQTLFGGSGFSFSQTSKPASTNSSATPVPSVSIFSLPSTTAVSTTTAANFGASLASTASSGVFPSFGAMSSSSATTTVTVVPASKVVSQSSSTTEISTSVSQAAPTTQTSAPSTTACTTGPIPASADVVTTSAPSMPAATQAAATEKPPTTSSTAEFSFSNLSLTPTTSAPSFGSTAFQTAQPSTTTTTSVSPLSFGGSVLSQPSVFGSKATQSLTSSAIGTPTTTNTTTTTITGTIFGGATATTTSSTLFQTPPKSAAAFSGSSLFGTPTTSAQSFGTPATTAPAFGTPTTSAPSAFGTPTTSAPSAFGTPTTATLSFGMPTTSAPVFGTPTSSTQPTFGTPTSSAPSVFGTPTTSAQPAFGVAASTAQSPFGSQTAAPAFSAATSSTSVFGAPTASSSTNLFGAVSALSNTSFFDSPTTTAAGFGAQAGSIFGGASSFSAPSTSASSIFGAKICSPDPAQAPANTSNPFGSPFGQKTPTAGATFGGTPSFGSFRPSTPGAFGSSGGSIFGGGAGRGGSSFRQPTLQGGIFQSAGSSPGVFGSPTQSPGAFWSPGQSVQQTGFGSFGAPQQQQPRPFGASGGSVFGGQAAFGSAPTFGGTATFGGSPTNKVFGATTPTPAFGSPTQQSSTFENLAAQNTVSFGNLAQTSPTFGGGSTFGQPQPQPQQQQQTPAFSNTPAFGGSSFSSWR